MRLFALLVIMLALAGCAAGEETPVEETEAEDTGVEEVASEEPTEIRSETTRSETTVPSAAAPNSEAAQSQQINAPPKKEEVVRDQGGVQTSQVRPETTAPSAATNSGATQGGEQANASPGNEEAIGKQDPARTQQGVSTTQKADPDPATVGQPLTFTISVMNHSVPQRVGFKDFLPPSMMFVSVKPSQGTCGTGHHGGNEVGCTLGLVPSGGTATVEIVATPTVPGTMKNTAVSLAEFTPASPANSNAANITVNPAS